MKKILCVSLALLLVLIFATPAFAAPVASPRYINTQSANATLLIDGNGLATISLRCIAYSGVSSITVASHLEIKDGNSWVWVDIGTTNDVWSDNVTTSRLIKTHTHQLNEPGLYRVVSEFTVTATQPETFTVTSEARL